MGKFPLLDSKGSIIKYVLQKKGVQSYRIETYARHRDRCFKKGWHIYLKSKVLCPSDGKIVFILKCSDPFRFLFWDLGQLGFKENGAAIAEVPEHCRTFLHNWKPNARLTPTQSNLKKGQYKGMCTSVSGHWGKRMSTGTRYVIAE